MSFENAPVSKGLMMSCALTSIIAGVFDVKHYLHLQFVPHISRHHQYWRLVAHHFAFSNSSDLLLAELLLYNVGVQVERQFGTVKFASFAIASALVSTILEFMALLLFYRIGLNHISPGPLSLIFAILYQYFRVVPSIYQFRIFSVPVSNKIFTYILASQLAAGHAPGSAVVALIGIITGQIYRSDLTDLKSWRLSSPVRRFATRFLLPLIGSTRPPRRLTRARPEPRTTTRTDEARVGNEEVITTARPASADVTGTRTGSTEENTGSSVMREWVNELTGRADSAGPGMRVPSEAEITQLTGMFPDVQRAVVVAALQRSPNVEGAVEILLSSSR